MRGGVAGAVTCGRGGSGDRCNRAVQVGSPPHGCGRCRAINVCVPGPRGGIERAGLKRPAGGVRRWEARAAQRSTCRACQPFIQQQVLHVAGLAAAAASQHAVRVRCAERVISVQFSGPAVAARREDSSRVGLHEQRPGIRISDGRVARGRSRGCIEGANPVEICLAQEVSLEDGGHVIRRRDVVVQPGRERAQLAGVRRHRHARPEGRARIQPHVVLAVARDLRE